MYNEDRKERFLQYKLNTSVNNIKPIEVKIKRAAKFEHMYKKDLCDFNFEEIIEMYKLLGFTSVEAIVIMNNVLSHYTNWCLSENLVQNGQNIYETITVDMLSRLLNRALLNYQVVERDTILTWAETFTNPRDKFILLSFFEYGKSKKNFEDTVNARYQDINEENHTMKLYSGRTVNVSDALIQFARLSNNTLETQLPYKRMTLVEDGTIIKHSSRLSNDPVRLARGLYNNFITSLSSIGVQHVSIDKISVSGQIDLINRKAKKYSVSGKELVYSEKYRSEIEAQFDISIQPGFFIKKYGDYLI